MKISLKRPIPRNSLGDPAFVHGHGPRLYDVFSPEEVTELVNRSLYQLEYQTKAHEKRRQERMMLEAPIKAEFYRLFPKTSWARATPEQVKRAMQQVQKNEKGEE